MNHMQPNTRIQDLGICVACMTGRQQLRPFTLSHKYWCLFLFIDIT